MQVIGYNITNCGRGQGNRGKSVENIWKCSPSPAGVSRTSLASFFQFCVPKKIPKACNTYLRGKLNTIQAWNTLALGCPILWHHSPRGPGEAACSSSQGQWDGGTGHGGQLMYSGLPVRLDRYQGWTDLKVEIVNLRWKWFPILGSVVWVPDLCLAVSYCTAFLSVFCLKFTPKCL